MIPRRNIDISKNIFLNCFIDIHIYSIFDYRTIIYQYGFVLITKIQKIKLKGITWNQFHNLINDTKLLNEEKHFIWKKFIWYRNIWNGKSTYCFFWLVIKNRPIFIKNGCVSILILYDDQWWPKNTGKFQNWCYFLLFCKCLRAKQE